jgi:hypothetical protein
MSRGGREAARRFGTVRAVASLLDERTCRAELAVVYLLIPAVLVGLWVLPGTEAWELDLSAPSVVATGEVAWAAFVSNYLHASVGHLLNNVAVFWLLMLAIYPLVVVGDWKREFFATATVFLLAGPFVVSSVSLALEMDATAVGFSGVGSAFLGVLLFVLFVASHAERGGPHPVWAVGPGLLAFAGAVAFAGATTWYLSAPPVVVAALGGSGTVVSLLVAHRHEGCLFGWGRSQYAIAYIFGVSVAFAVWVTGFLTVGASTTNVLAHLAGFLAGFTVPYLAFGLQPAVLDALARRRGDADER